MSAHHLLIIVKLNALVDENFRPISDSCPDIVYLHFSGMVGESSVGSLISITNINHPAASIATGTINTLWESYFRNLSKMMIKFL